MEGYLAHHGVKGMKWGVRRYRNQDGSLTSEGREQYTSTASSSRQSFADRAARRSREREYKKLMRERLYGGFVSFGKELAKSVFSDTVKNLTDNGNAVRFGKYITERFLGNKSALLDSIVSTKLGNSNDAGDNDDDDDDE